VLLVFVIAADWGQHQLLRASGELIGDGFRYLVPLGGVIALLGGVGLARGVEAAAAHGLGRRWPWAGAGLLALSPLVTHHALLSDRSFDQMTRYAALSEAVGALPPDTLLLLPDHGIASPGADGPRQCSLPHTRGAHLLEVLRMVRGIPARVDLARCWAASNQVWEGPIVLLVDTTCRMSADGTMDPLCRHALASSRLHARWREFVPARPYSRYPRIDEALGPIELALLDVPDRDALDALIAALPVPDRACVCGGLP